MNNNTKNKILNTVKKMFTYGGYESISIRNIADKISISPSVIYHYYNNKDEILDRLFENIRKDLGRKREKIIRQKTVYDMLRSRVEFQFVNAIDVIYILKYYTHFRKKFLSNDKGFVPKEAYSHIREVLIYGVEQKEFENSEIDAQAKVITHAVNGFVLEYYPKIPKGKEKEKLVDEITKFIYRGIKKKGGEKNGRK